MSTARRSGHRVLTVVVLAALAVALIGCLGYLEAARGRVADGLGLSRSTLLPSVSAYMDHVDQVRADWSILLLTFEASAAALLAMVVWGAVLVLKGGSHARQWGTILTLASIIALFVVLFRGAGLAGTMVDMWFSPQVVRAIQSAHLIIAVAVAVLAWLQTRRAPAPLGPEYDRDTIVSYTPLYHQPSPNVLGSDLEQAETRAESTLPPDRP